MQATMIAGSIRSRKPRVVRPSAESCLCVLIGDSEDWETNGRRVRFIGWTPTSMRPRKIHKLCKSEQRAILMVSTINDATARKSDTDQRVGRTLWPPSIFSPLFSPETFDLTRGALCAKKRPSIISSKLNHINALCLVKQWQLNGTNFGCFSDRKIVVDSNHIEA